MKIIVLPLAGLLLLAASLPLHAQSDSNASWNVQGGSHSDLAVPPELKDDAQAANDVFERRDYEAAESIYGKMLMKAPNSVYVLGNLGMIYFREGKFNLAEETLKKATTLAQDSFSWCTLAIVYYQEKRYDDAMAALKKALAINPNYAIAFNYLGLIASQKGSQDEAVADFQKAIALDPKYSDAYFNLAVVYAILQPPKKEPAREAYNHAIELGGGAGRRSYRAAEIGRKPNPRSKLS